MTTEEEELSGSEGGSGGVESESINIKLRFLDESELDVTTKLSECLRRFRRRHLDSHLSLSPTDKVSNLLFRYCLVSKAGFFGHAKKKLKTKKTQNSRKKLKLKLKTQIFGIF